MNIVNELVDLEFKNNNDFITLFERRLSEFTGAPYVVLTDSCSNAIFLCLKYFQKYRSYDISSELLLIPEKTYISVPQSIINAGFTPIFNEKKWEQKYKIGDLPIYDYAVGFKKNIYKEGQFQCLSFQQKKTLNIGKGGAILLDNEDAYYTLKRMSWDGRDLSKSSTEDFPIHGYHMNMIPDDAAKGVLILNQLDNKKIKDGLKNYKFYKKLTKFF